MHVVGDLVVAAVDEVLIDQRESTAVDRLMSEEVTERMSEVFAIRLLDALDGNGPHVRSHDGGRLIAGNM